MPPPHLAVLNAQNSDDGRPGTPERGLLARFRASVTASFEGSAPAARPGLFRVPLLQPPGKPAEPAAAIQAESAPLVPPAEAPSGLHSLLARPAAVLHDPPVALAKPPRPPEPVPMAKSPPPRDREDLLADLPPAQVPLRISVAPLPFASPAPAPVPAKPGARNAAAERAFRTGREGTRPAHAMSAAEVAAWREGAMEAGRARDPIIGRPRLWWWLALGLLLVLPLAYAAGWAGLSGSGAEFLSTPLGQEAWIMLGGADAAWVYYGLLFSVALALQFLRPLEPVLILCAATWWGWTGLHAAWVAGWLAQRIPPLPMPG